MIDMEQLRGVCDCMAIECVPIEAGRVNVVFFFNSLELIFISKKKLKVNLIFD